MAIAATKHTVMEESVQTNGTVPMPIKTVHIPLDDLGYLKWFAVMRINPRSSDYDDFMSDDKDKEWKGFSALVVNWNFGDEDGNPIPLPKDSTREVVSGMLPHKIISFMVDKWLTAFNEAYGLPKEPATPLEDSSTPSEQDE